MIHQTIHPAAAVVLAPGVTVETGCLRDATGREHPVDDAGLAVARLCRVPVGVDGVVIALASRSGIPAHRMVVGIQRFIVQLQARGLASVHQSFLRELWSNLVLFPFDVVTFAVSRSLRTVRFSSRRMYAPSLAAILRATVEAFAHLAAFAGAVLVLVAAVVLFAFPAVPEVTLIRLAIITLIASSAVLAVMATAVVHESAHYLVARALRARVLGIVVRRGAVSVVFRSGSSAVRRLVAVSGPVAGAVFAAGVLTVLVCAGSPAPPDNVRLSIGALALVIALAQLFCLLPLSADGRAVFGKTETPERAPHA